MIRLADYVARRLTEHGVSRVFMISGGGAMHLNDAVGKCPGLEYFCSHHEQASAIGAEGYSRVSGKLGVTVVTTGPGGTNALTGVIGQWLDSIPALYISGQVKFKTTIASCPEAGLRQLGDQEINITDIVRPVTKFSYLLTDPLEVKRALDKAVRLATTGRPGPVWLDIPFDVQAALIDETKLPSCEPEPEPETPGLKEKISETLKMLRAAKRPALIAGHGIRLAGAEAAFEKLADALKIPVLATFAGFDLVPDESPWFAGRIGTVGTRGGNFSLQNADLVVSLGSRNNIRQVSYDWGNFARRAKKIIVDIDPAELKKPTVKPDLAVNADVKDFIEGLLGILPREGVGNFSGWLAWCRERNARYPVVLEEYKKLKEGVSPYHFIHELTGLLSPDVPVVSGNGSACVCLFQAGIVKKGQKMFFNSGCASMGYDLPAAIGACLGSGGKKTVCLAGDGSIMMNLQELATVAHYKLPVKIFVLNNGGYISIKQTQENFFQGRLVACGPSSGVGFPDFARLGEAFGLYTAVITSAGEMREKIEKVMASEGPALCDVRLPADYKFMPKLSSEKKADGTMVSKPLEDMWPFLDRKEFEENIIG
ncbi:MAG: acetolactate synthase [Elusimicrobia bacterium CG08_land_8_20_14_0_20_51_18]|nr:MAG: acetolactate synthase [Elusimicrobia bacterium CG08_land_8_20_14_0_20_51_18]